MDFQSQYNTVANDCEENKVLEGTPFDDHLAVAANDVVLREYVHSRGSFLLQGAGGRGRDLSARTGRTPRALSGLVFLRPEPSNLVHLQHGERLWGKRTGFQKNPKVEEEEQCIIFCPKEINSLPGWAPDDRE